MCVFAMFCTTVLWGQVSPALGPLPVGKGDTIAIPISYMRDILVALIKDSVLPSINADIKAYDPPTATKVTLNRINILQSVVRQTRHANRPNSKCLVARFEVLYDINIKWAPNKRMRQHIEVEVASNNWFHPSGDTLTVMTSAYKPQILDAGLTEKIINFFTAGEYTSKVNSLIRPWLPDIIQSQLYLQGFSLRFNRMNIDDSGTADYTDDKFLFQFKAPSSRPNTITNAIRLTPLRIKRLIAYNIDSGQPAYDSVENIQLQFYANHSYGSVNFPGFTEGQERQIDGQQVSTTMPEDGQSLVLVWNIQQQTGKTDSGFKVFSASGNFGNGLHTIRVKKTFIQRSIPLPSGQRSRPIEVTLDAYEITYRINVGADQSIGYR